MGWFRDSERERWAGSRAAIRRQGGVGLPALDAKTAWLYGEGLPRNVPLLRTTPDREPINTWMDIAEAQWAMRYVPGQLLLGKLGHTLIGHLDDRPMVTIAGARAGKSSTVLEPNLYMYPGSMVVLDPKGELAAKAAAIRAAGGHRVYVLDPFGQSGCPTSRFNVLHELDPDSDLIVDDVASITQAIIVDEGDSKNKHWNDSARTLLQGIILLTLTFPKEERNLITVRQLLNLTHPKLADAVRHARHNIPQQGRLDLGEETAPGIDFFKENKAALETLLLTMASKEHLFEGILAAIGRRFLNTPPNERGSIFSTAAAQTDFFDSIPLRRISRTSDFRLRDLAGDQPITLFLCLPVGRMESHYRWLRMVVQQAMTCLEQLGTYPRHKTPILFMMEEMSTLGHLDLLERAAAYAPGFGIKLWCVLQDLTQLKRYYQAGWETFIANAGILQVFSNSDLTTLEYIARRTENLVHPFEIRTAFARNRHTQILMVEGQPPLAALRLEHDDVAEMRRRIVQRPPMLR